MNEEHHDEILGTPTLGLKMEPNGEAVVPPKIHMRMKVQPAIETPSIDPISTPAIEMPPLDAFPAPSIDPPPDIPAPTNIKAEEIPPMAVPYSDPTIEVETVISSRTRDNASQSQGAWKTREIIDFAEHRVPVQPADIPYNEVAEKQPRIALGKPQTIDRAEIRTPLPPAHHPSNIPLETPNISISVPEKPQSNEMPADPEFTLDDESEAELILKGPNAMPPSQPVIPLTQTTVDRVLKTLQASSNTTVGQMLRATRESTGMTLSEVNTITSIREAYLAALENDDDDALPSRVFVIGYIRSLCNIYHLDSKCTQIIIDRYNHTQKEEVDEIETKENVANEDIIPWFTIKPYHIMILFMILIISIVGLSAYLIFGNSKPNPLKTTAGTTIAPTASSTAKTLSNPSSEKFSTEKMKVLYTEYQPISLTEMPEK